MARRKQKPKKFARRMQKKLLFVFSFITLCLIGLIGRLMYLEYARGDKYEKIVLSQQEYDSRTIPFQRGDIVDTKGTVLATSVDVYNVVFDCKVLNQNTDDIDDTIAALCNCFPELKSEELYQKLKDKPTSQYEVLLKKLSYETIQPFVEMQSDKDKYPKVNSDAVWFEKEYIRNYPNNSLAASLIGFVSGGNVGTIGLENYYNSTLNGINGRQYGYLNSDNNFEKTIREARDGNMIVSTIDVNIQSVVEEKLAKFNQEYANGFTQGDGSLHTAAIVMNPQNGEIYAMANYPTFDLNQPRDYDSYFTAEELAGKTEDEKMDMLNQLWENFCVTYTYEPGSTQKPFTVATGLETGTLSGNETYVCDGFETFPGDVKVRCVSRVGHGVETVEKALMDSCNDALMQMSYAIGPDNFATYQSIFGFGKKTGIDLPGEAVTEGLLFDRKQLDQKINLATNSFGQNYNCTMIQMASAFSSLINGGKYYRPHVVKKILDSDGNTLETMKPVLLKQTVSKETSDMIRQYLYATVSEGTANTAKVNGYSMGGKTGTAQKLPRAEKQYLVSFIGYAPQENPQLVIYVIIDQPNVEEQAHSSYAQQIAKEMLTEILPYMNIYQDEELQPEDDDGTQTADQTAAADAAGTDTSAQTTDQTAVAADTATQTTDLAAATDSSAQAQTAAEGGQGDTTQEGTSQGEGDTSGEGGDTAQKPVAGGDEAGSPTDPVEGALDE